MDVLDELTCELPRLNKAASEVGRNLSRTGILKDIALSAELAGLALLRRAGASIPNVSPGTVVMGMVDSASVRSIERFMGACAADMGLRQADVEGARIPTGAMAYCRDLTEYEARLYQICRASGIKPAHYAFVGAFAAVKFVGGGARIGILDKNIGFALALFHVGAGCNTVPYA